MKSYSSREIITMLKKYGWFVDSCTVDHYQFKHPHKAGKVTVPHPRKDLKIGTLKNILKQAGIEGI